MTNFRDPQFFDELKQINEQFLDIIKRGNERSPYYDFSPACNDYIALLKDLENQYPDKNCENATISSIGLVTSGFVFASSSNNLDNQQNNCQNNGGDDDDDNQGDDVPPEPKIDKYEEPDSMFSIRCKLYVKTDALDNKLVLLGVGSFFVKDLGSGKQQVVVRQEPDLRRVLLNEYINANIPVKKRPKTVQIIFPHTVDGKDKSNSLYLVKLKDDNDADALYSVLNGSKK